MNNLGGMGAPAPKPSQTRHIDRVRWLPDLFVTEIRGYAVIPAEHEKFAVWMTRHAIQRAMRRPLP